MFQVGVVGCINFYVRKKGINTHDAFFCSGLRNAFMAFVGNDEIAEEVLVRYS